MRARTTFGFIVLGEAEVSGRYRPPTLDEQVFIDEYRGAYKKAKQREPHGLHFLYLGTDELTALRLPLEDLSPEDD